MMDSMGAARDALVEEFGLDEETLFMDGYDDCIVGVCEQFGRPAVVAYDKDRVLDRLVQSGMSEDEAEEWFYVNQHGGWHGEYTPVFVMLRGVGDDAI